MYIFLAIIIVIAALLLIGAVLVQKSKGGGLASNYNGANQFMGYRKTTDFIEKTTWTLAIIICVLSISASFALKPKTEKMAVQQQKEAAAPKQDAATTAQPASQEKAAPATTAPAAEQKAK